jgi:hypothetical protein
MLDSITDIQKSELGFGIVLSITAQELTPKLSLETIPF